MNSVVASTLWPWVIAAAGIVVGTIGWLREAPPAGSVAAIADSEGLRRLRATLVSAKAENGTLRKELDRVLGLEWVKSLKGSGEVASALTSRSVSEAVEMDPELRERAERLKDSLARAAQGDRDALVTFGTELMLLMKQGRAGFPILLELYLDNPAPFARRNLLPTMLLIGGPEARDFVLSQAERESDPTIRRSLLSYAARTASPEVSKRLEKPFLQSLASAGDENQRATAVRGLRFSESKEVQDALLGAASDPSPKVRLAAFNVLGSRGLGEQLREIAAADAEPRVRKFAECRLLMAENLP